MAALDAATRTKSLPVIPSRTSLEASISGGNSHQHTEVDIHFQVLTVCREDIEVRKSARKEGDGRKVRNSS